MLAALTSGDSGKRLSAAERVDLMGTAQVLTDAGKLAVADSLALVEKFHAGPEGDVVQNAITLALGPHDTLVPEDLIPNYQRFLLKNFQQQASQLGWAPQQGEIYDTRMLRPRLVFTAAAYGGDPKLAAEGKALAAKWLDNHSTVAPETLSVVMGTGAFYGDKALFDRYLAAFRKTEDKQIRGSLLFAMTMFRDPAAIEAGMNALLTGDIPFIEGSQLLFSGQKQAPTRRLALAFLKSHWDEVVAKMPIGGGFDFGASLPNVGTGYCDAASRDELKNFFAPRVGKFVGAPRALDQIIEGIDLCIANKAAQGPAVAAFLAKY